MKKRKQKRDLPQGEKNLQMLQWHPAFYAGLQIELMADAENLIFESEHQLGTRPREIDVLVVKKEKEIPVHKNIGKIFRRYNIIEYKGPTDYLSIDDFYKGYAYICLYKSEACREDIIKLEELTISFVCTKYPKKLVRHLAENRKFSVFGEEQGIYYVYGDAVPIQIIVTEELAEDKNLWIKGLTNQLSGPEIANRLIMEYRKHKTNNLYKSVMNIIVRANKAQFKEEKSDMCEALVELFREEIDAMAAEVVQQAKEQAREQALEEGLEEGLEQGRKQGIQEGRQEGRQEGIQQGIEIFIQTCNELGVSRAVIFSKLREKFGMSEQESGYYIEKYC